MSLLLQKLYRYHAWANIDLFDKLGTLDEEKYETELHTSSRLINHYHVVAEIFAAHLSGMQNLMYPITRSIRQHSTIYVRL